MDRKSNNMGRKNNSIDRKEMCKATLNKCFKHIMHTLEQEGIWFGIACETDEQISYFTIDPNFFQIKSKTRSKLIRQTKIALDEYQLYIDSLKVVDEEIKQ